MIFDAGTPSSSIRRHNEFAEVWDDVSINLDKTDELPFMSTASNSSTTRFMGKEMVDAERAIAGDELFDTDDESIRASDELNLIISVD